MNRDLLREYRYHRANGGTAQGSLDCARTRLLLDEAIDEGVAEIVWEPEQERYEDVFGFEDDAERDRFYRDLESGAITGPYWCALYVSDAFGELEPHAPGDIVASVGMITLGPRDISGDYYARLTEVELAGEAEDELRQAIGDARDREMSCTA